MTGKDGTLSQLQRKCKSNKKGTFSQLKKRAREVHLKCIAWEMQGATGTVGKEKHTF